MMKLYEVLTLLVSHKPITHRKARQKHKEQGQQAAPHVRAQM